MSIEGLPHFIPEGAQTLEQASAPGASKVDQVAQGIIGNLDVLPEEMLLKIVEKLDLSDLLQLGQCSSFWLRFGNDHKLWELIAEKIGCGPTRAEVELFIKDLIKKVKIWCPPDLQKIGPLTISRILHMKKFLIARDIIEVWDYLGHAINPLAEQIEIHGFDLETCTSEDIIANADHFNAWFMAHLAVLDQLTELAPTYRYLTHIPPQIWHLTNLTKLELQGNLLSTFPIECKTVPSLVELDLTGNPIKWDIGEKHYDPLLLTAELLKTLPKEIQEQIGCSNDPSDIEQLKDLSMVKLTNQIPALIQYIVKKNALTVEEHQTLCAWRKAAHTLISWKTISEKENPEASFRDIFGVDENHFNSTQNYLDMAAHFAAFVPQHFELEPPRPSNRLMLVISVTSVLAIATLAARFLF